MQARLARGLHERLDALLVQRRLDGLRHGDDVGEGRLARVEVEEHEVGPVEVLGPRRPDVEGQRPLVHEVEQRRLVVDQGVVDGLAPLGLQLDARNPVGVVVRRVLLPEMRGLLGEALGQAFERDRPVLEERQEPVGDLLVVGEDVRLGEPGLGVDDAVGVGELDRLRGLAVPARAGRSVSLAAALGFAAGFGALLAPGLGELVLQLHEQPLRLALAAGLHADQGELPLEPLAVHDELDPARLDRLAGGLSGSASGPSGSRSPPSSPTSPARLHHHLRPADPGRGRPGFGRWLCCAWAPAAGSPGRCHRRAATCTARLDLPSARRSGG